MPNDPAAQRPLGRFDHHPDPAIDFCVEVEEIQSIVSDAGFGLRQWSELGSRIQKAMDFRVGGDLGAVRAKALLRTLEKLAAQNMEVYHG